jgi:hypothetical protein
VRSIPVGETLVNQLSSFIRSVQSNPIVGGISVAITVAMIVVLLIAGSGFLSSLLYALLVGIIIYFGSIKLLAGSLVLAILLKNLFYPIQKLVYIFIPGPKAQQLMSLVQETKFWNLVFLIFFVTFTLQLFTGSIRIFQFNNSTKIEKKKSEDDD